MPRITILTTLTIAVILVFCHSDAFAQQYADTLFRPKVGPPAYKEGKGPTVLIDEAHNNFHTMEGRYLPFARLLQKDGYVVKPQRRVFTRSDLDRATILVIANALPGGTQDVEILPTPPAFDSAEIAAVRDWVNDGGSLWLIADHMPFSGAAESLAVQFGILMPNGFALRAGTEDGLMKYRRSDGSLADDAITRGRNSAERIDSIVAFTGQAFRFGGPGEPLMTLGRDVDVLMPQVAWQFSALTPRMSGWGMLQGGIMHVGKGRVAVFGEAAMFSAQVAEPGHRLAGMNSPAAPQNAQFTLNVAHWLSRLF